MKAFFPAPEDPAGTTFSTLNLTVFEIGLKIEKKKKLHLQKMHRDEFREVNATEKVP